MNLTPFKLPEKPIKSTPKAIAKACADFERTIGGRAQLIAVLSIVEMTPDIERVLGVIGDPDCDKIPLAELCFASQLQPGQVFSAYHKAQIQRVQMEAFSTIATALPDVLKEIARTALPHDERCESCHGTGWIQRQKRKAGRGRNPKPLPCQSCEGKGKRRVNGSAEQQEKVLDLAKLVSKGGGINLMQQVNNNPPASSSGGGSLDLLQQAASAILSTRLPLRGEKTEPVVEATIVPSE